MASACNNKLALFLWTLLLFFKSANSNNVVPNTPQANEVVPVDQPYNITWDQSNAPIANTVFIGLLHSGNGIGNLTSSTPNNGSYLWIPDIVFAGSSDYFLMICPIGDPGAGCGYTSNGRFSFGPAPASSSSTTSRSFSSSSATTQPSTSSTPSSTTSLATSPTTSSIPTSSPLSSSSSTSTLPPTQSAASKASTSSPSLSVGVIVAITIVIPVFVIAVAGLILFLLWKRYKARKNSNSGGAVAGGGYPAGGGGGGGGYPVGEGGYPKPELTDRTAGANMAEVHNYSNWGGQTRPYELEEPSPGNRLYELGASKSVQGRSGGK